MDKPLALPAPATGRDVVPATGTDLVTTTGTEIIPMVSRSEVAKAHEQAKPKEIPRARERDPDRMTARQARSLVNRVRRTRFYLWVPVSVYESPYKGELDGHRSTQFVRVTAQQLMDLLTAVEKKDADGYVRVRYNQDTMYIAVN